MKMEFILFERMAEIFLAIIGNPLVYLPLIGAWIITSIYFIINKDEALGHTYVMSTGIAHIFTAYVVSPFAKSDVPWSLGDLRTIVVLILFLYGVFLVVLGILKAFPDALAEFFGNESHLVYRGIVIGTTHDCYDTRNLS